MRSLKQSGDTIVEVLLAIAVVSAVLGGAYVSATRSLNGNRQAQERAEATKLAEGQLERLKVIISDPNQGILANDVYCIDDNVADATVDRIDFDSAVTAMPALSADGTINYPAGCRITNGVRYDVSIARNGQNFTVRARWDGSNGNGKDEVAIVYRAY
jgi:type II secretory pathway pseudopilin PulG